MLDYLYQYLNPGSSRILPLWQRHVINIDGMITNFRRKFKQMPLGYSGCTDFFRYILLNLDTKYLLSDTPMIDKYTQYIIPQADVFRSSYDPVFGNKQLELSSSKISQEFTLNVDWKNEATILPLQANWDVWENIKPTRILSNNTFELCHNLINSQLNYTKQAPTYIVLSLNFSSLIIKYIKYIEFCKITGFHLDVNNFIRDHVMMTWFDDLLQCWLMRLINKALESNWNGTELTKRSLTINSQLISEGPLLQMIESLNKEIKRTGDDITTVETFLNMRWFNNVLSINDTGFISYMDLIKDRINKQSLPNLKQYNYLKFMRDIDIVKAIAMIDRYSYINGGTSRLALAIYRTLERYNWSNMFANIQSSALKAQLNYDLFSLKGIVKQSL